MFKSDDLPRGEHPNRLRVPTLVFQIILVGRYVVVDSSVLESLGVHVKYAISWKRVFTAWLADRTGIHQQSVC